MTDGYKEIPNPNVDWMNNLPEMAIPPKNEEEGHTDWIRECLGLPPPPRRNLWNREDAA